MDEDARRDARGPEGRGSARGVVLALVAVVAVLVLGALVVVLRLTREPALPPAPHGAAELGPLPAPGGPWSVLVREDARLRSPLGPDGLRDRFSPDQPDEGVSLERDAVAGELAEVDLSELDRALPVLDALYAGPLEDGCAEPAGGCPGMAVVRAAQRAELVILARWTAGDDAGARALLTRALRANLGLARTGRTVLTQMVGLVALARGATLALALRRAGLVPDPDLARALAEVASAEVDLGRGWVGEVVLADHTLRTLGGSTVAERLFLDRAEAARRVYASQEECIAYARDAAAPRPPPVAVPGAGPGSWMLSDATATLFVEAMLVECAEPIDRARQHLDTAQRRARATLDLAAP